MITISKKNLERYKMKTLKEDKIRINFELSKDLFEKLRQKAAEQELTYSAFIRQLIKKAVE